MTKNMSDVRDKLLRIAKEVAKKREDVDLVRYDESNFALESLRFRLNIKCNPSWLGYDLEIKKPTLGKKFGTFVDNDNYLLEDNFVKELSLQIETLLNAIHDRQVLVGKQGKALFLVFPESKTKNTLVVRANIFSGYKKSITADKTKEMKFLYPL